jgi:hypothetical protein
MTALREVPVGIAPTVPLCPYIAPTSHKGHDTYAVGPLCYKQHEEVKLDPRLTKHSCLRSDIREQLSSHFQLSGELAGILKLQPVVLLRVSLRRIRYYTMEGQVKAVCITRNSSTRLLAITQLKEAVDEEPNFF